MVQLRVHCPGHLSLITTLLYVCLACLSFAPMTSSQGHQYYTYQNRDFVLIQKGTKFEQAVTICKNRNARLVEIRSVDEQNFVYNTIVKPMAGWLWLGATNVVGTRTFKWLRDGSDLTYSNWLPSHPNKDINARSAIAMQSGTGKWWDDPVSGTNRVLCELLTSNQLEQSNQCNAKIKGLEDKITIETRRSSSTLRIEFLRLIKEGKDNQSQVNNRLEDRSNDVTAEVEFHKRQTKELTSKLNTELEKQSKLMEQLKQRININEQACSEKIARLNDRFNLERQE